MLFYTDCKTNRRPEAQHRERPNLLAALAVLAACASSRQTLAASFDCQRASTRLEVMICSDPTLSALDDQLDAGYKAADARHAVPALREEQRAWLAQRARCADAACLGDMYRHRVVDLSAIAAAASPAVRYPDFRPSRRATDIAYSEAATAMTCCSRGPIGTAISHLG